jgi:hypothetical protein
MRGTKARALRDIYVIMKQTKLKEGEMLISFRELKKRYLLLNRKQRSKI